MAKPGRAGPDRSNDELLTSTEAALRLRVAPGTLIDWRFDGRGPCYSRLDSGAIRYWRNDIDTWIDAQRVEPVDAT